MFPDASPGHFKRHLEELEVILMDVIDEPVALTPMEGEICGPDERVICITLRRPQEEDGFVVEHHWAESCIVSGNTVKLGTAQDGKTAAFYQVKYTTKNNCEPIELAPLLVRSHQLATKYGSVASDSGTRQRFANHVLQKVLNKVCGLQFGCVSARVAA